MLSACSTSSSPATTPAQSTSPAPAPPRLAATATQYTVDEASGDLRVGITNMGHSRVTVTSAALDWAGFAPKPAAVEGGRLGPGDVAGVLMQYGAPRCGSPPTGRPGLSVVVDGVTRRVPLKVEVPHLLTMLYQRECSDERLASAVDLSLVMARTTVVRNGEEYLPGEIVVRRKQPALAVTVLDLSGSVLLRFQPLTVHGLPARHAPGEPTLRVPIRLVSAHRCDPHARANSSQTFVLSIDVHLDGQPAQRVVVQPDKATQVILLGLIASDCR